MHFHFNFSAAEILWTLTFAGLLVLLVVLLGRDRARRFPWFTASMVLMALRMVASRLLAERLPQITFSEVFLGLSDVAAIVALGLVVEIARRAFKGASRAAWIVGTVVLLAVGGVITAKWGPWPAWKTLIAGSELSALRLMQLFGQKANLLADLLLIQLGLVVVLFGRRFGAGFRSHTQQLAIGLSTASIAETAVRLIWQQIAEHTSIHSQADYAHVMSLQDKLYSANNVLYLVVLVWWIVCLWIDEPGSAATAGVVATAEILAIADESTPQSDEATSKPDANAGSSGKTTDL
jgi:hypothetical protein